ncbi:hypothetical protein DFH07DRAFT_759351 [Mycena maculata]|uniref:Uncharacterized protein n=1 Tax=Mycena maculata TaxID=230809 RepID=A0AAD7HMA0_9AGAR|nr:hypothetical protein DFH07DRAFT_759351 [Mycena maculata]
MYTTLFQKHITGQKLTGPVGLSNVLAWFAAGQGAPTEGFLNHLSPFGGFFADTAVQMISNFQLAISHNEQTLGALPLKFDNTQAWGKQPNAALLAQPPKPEVDHHSLEDKFGLMFSQNVQTIWATHIGALRNQDPNTSDAPRSSWSSTLKLIKDLEIPALKTGLTAMQLVNTLAFSKVVQLPTIQEMAAWIAGNDKLGAVAGLKYLEYQVNTSDEIQGAYISFHNYLDRYLMPEDKGELGFHPAFTEHILCKTPRWDRYLQDDTTMTMSQMAEALPNSPWTPGKNRTDPRATAFPLPVCRENLNTALPKEKVCWYTACKVRADRSF